MAKRDQSLNNAVLVRNRQRACVVDLRLWREIARTLLRELLQRESFELVVYLTTAPEMTKLNETYLHLQGSTDVLAFDYSEPTQPGVLCGEIFVCVDEAQIQAARFRTTWQSELVRYLAHGVLHLCGYDDHRNLDRRKMKTEENRLLRQLAGRFQFSRLGRRRTQVLA